MLATHDDLLRKITAPERKYDKRFVVVFEAIRDLMLPRSNPPRRQIGFKH